MEDLTREERRALAMKKAQARRSNVQIGQRKVHLKIKKAAKSVQGDIDAAKKRLGKSLPVLLPDLLPTSRTNIQDIYFSFSAAFVRLRYYNGAITTEDFETANIWKRNGASFEAPRNENGCGKSFSDAKTTGERPGARKRRRKSLVLKRRHACMGEWRKKACTRAISTRGKRSRCCRT